MATGIIVMKVFLFVVMAICITGIIGSFNPKVENFFRKLFHKVFD